jgi:UDP-N-acetylmuramate dehydrogenase
MIFSNASLKNYNTLGLDYKANRLVIIKSEEEAVSLVLKHNELIDPVLVLGGGSNILFTGDYNGTILHPEIPGIKIREKEGDQVVVSAGAGVKWDDLVEWTVKNDFYGLENLSLIPGTAGAAAVQNIGAYGAEIKDYIFRVRCLSLIDAAVVEFNNQECRFSYRNSIFKQDIKGHFLISEVFFRLSMKPTLNISYGSLQKEAENIGKLSQKTIRQAVINIRTSKLPDPSVTGNAGSFFKNPVISGEKAEILQNRFPSIPKYSESSGETKIAAGWLIDQCGWKGKRIGDAGVHEKQALVLVNYGNASGRELLDLSEMIRRSVYEKFGIDLEREVEVI